MLNKRASEKAALNEVIPSLDRTEGQLVFVGRQGRMEKDFRAVRRDVEAVAECLESAGVRAGSNVGLLAANCYEWLLTDLACILLGSVSVPFDARREWNVEQLHREYELAVLVTDAAGPVPPRTLPIHALPVKDPGNFRSAYRFAPQEPYTVKFSSGTTAEPKAVQTRALHFDHMATHVLNQFPLDASDRYLLLLPLSVYLQRFFVHVSILAGSSVSVGPMERAWALLQKERPTILVAVPQLLKSLLSLYHSHRDKNPDATLRDLFGGRLRYLWTGTAPIDHATLLEYEREGVPVYEGYGMTETGLIAKNYPGAHRLGSVGKSFPGKFVELGPAGEVVVRSAYHANDGYWRGRDDDIFLGDGRVATGDVGRFDEDGFLYLVGRTKEAIVLSTGHKVFPSTVEQRLLSSGPIKECVLYGQGQPFLVALLVARSEDVTEEQLSIALAQANQEAPVHEQVLAFLRLRDDQNVPRTAAGKLDRQAVHSRFGHQLQQLYTREKPSALNSGASE